MKYVSLGNTGAKVSEVCLGTMMCGTAMDKERSFQVLDHFTTEMQGNFIDTANCYAWWFGNGEFIGDESENILGEWMHTRKNRDKVFLSTKVGGRLKNPHTIRDNNGIVDWDRVKQEYEGLSKSVIIREVENSLLRLKTDYIDLYYTHVYDNSIAIEETMDALNTLIVQGKVRYIGASNLSTSQLKNANLIAISKGLRPYSVLQQEYSYIHPNKDLDAGIINHADNQMLEYVNSNNLGFCAYSPLLKGIYTNQDKKFSYYNWPLFNSQQSLEKLALVEKLSSELNITGNQLVLCWMLKQCPTIVPLLGFSKTEQYFENIQAVNIELPQDILFAMNKAITE